MKLNQRPLRTIYNALSVSNCSLLTAYIIVWCNILLPIDDFIYFSTEKIIILCSYRALFVPPKLLHTH